MSVWGNYRSMYDCDYPPEWDEDDETYEDEEDELTDEELEERKTDFLIEQDRAEKQRIAEESHEHPWRDRR